ncbi:peptidylprolyl isomerase [Lederbergia sp. NSJ-179]|uniref:peptidylprolyl isomerase n=1 Tax=Lederbergia sp. NSJ-179 TaxID=2931402 RepID=UPI001FD296CF|nr:peptidylprolyl isomerase [Lederbergia sp. NSJ-179]MCJ7840425.1 peptidylprolyl isomerase [Lederbergia sp. NSJ-179]
MKKWVLSLTLAAGVVGLAACSGNGGDTIAKSKAGNVTKDELYESMKEQIGDQALQQLVIEKVLNKEYKVSDKELDKELKKLKDQLGPQFEMQLTQAGFKDEDAFRDVLRLNLLQQKAATKDIKVTDEEVKEYYEQKEPDIDVNHIIVKDEKTAKEVKKKLDNGEKFADLAKEYSQDQSAQTGGELGTISRDDPQMDEDFKKAAFALKEGEISDPVKTQFGWHIIEVTKKPKKEAYDKVKDEYTQELKVSKLDQDSVTQAMKRELKKAKVEIKDKDLKDAVAPILDAPNPEDTTDDLKSGDNKKDDAPATDKEEK